MLKVLMISALFPPDFGGAPVQSLRLAKALQQKGVHVEFLTDNGSRPSLHEVYEGVPVTRVRTYSANAYSKLREILFAFRIFLFVVFRPDLKILHFHSIRGIEGLFFPLYRLMGRKILLKLTLAESDDPLTFKRRRLLGSLYFWGLSHVHKMAAISRRLTELAYEAKVPNDRVKLVFNGIDAESFSLASATEKAQIRREIGVSENAFVFLSIGQIEHRKGYDLLVRAYYRLLKDIPNAELLIVGPGNEDSNAFYRSLKDYLAAHHLDRVRFVGKQSNVQAYVKASDCFIFCSRQEGFGTVLIEAMACGVPTAAINIKGITEDIITDERIGAICYTQDPDDLARAVLALLKRTNPVGLSQAADDVRTRFSINYIGSEYISLYDEMLATQ